MGASKLGAPPSTSQRRFPKGGARSANQLPIMSQLLSFRALIGLSLAVAMFAFLGTSPLKAFTSTLQRAGLDWFSTQQSTSAASASASTSPKMSMTSKTPVYFFSHGGVSLWPIYRR